MKKKFTAVLATAAALALILTGCAGEKGSGSGSADASSSVSSGVTSNVDNSSQVDEPAGILMLMNGADFPGMTPVRGETHEDGTYWLEDVVQDRGMTIVNRGVLANDDLMGEDVNLNEPQKYMEALVHDGIDPEAYDFQVESAQTPESFKGSYPTYYCTWKTGGNEDTKQCDGVIVLTDTHNYFYYFSVYMDDYAEMEQTFGDVLLQIQLEETVG